MTFWHVAGWEKKDTLKVDNQHSIVLIAYAPDGKTLATVPYNSHEVQLWDLERKKPRTTLKGHTNTVMAVAFSPDGTTVATTGYDSTIRLWDAADGKEKDSLRAHDGVIYSLAFLPDGRLVSGGADKTVIVWDVKKGNPLRPVLELPPPAERGQVVYVFATPAGGIFSASRGWDLDVWEPRHSKPLFHRKGYVTPPGGPVFAIVSRGTTYYTRMTLSPDGKMLAGVDGNDVEVYDVSPYAMPAR